MAPPGSYTTVNCPPLVIDAQDRWFTVIVAGNRSSLGLHGVLLVSGLPVVFVHDVIGHDVHTGGGGGVKLPEPPTLNAQQALVEYGCTESVVPRKGVCTIA